MFMSMIEIKNQVTEPRAEVLHCMAEELQGIIGTHKVVCGGIGVIVQ